MSRAVRLNEYGDRDVLYIADVEVPAPKREEVVVAVRAAGINPGEASIRKGLLKDRFPTTFPSGQGTDFAGIVHAIGDAVTGFAVGDEVIGWCWTRASHADFVAVPVGQLVPKPGGVAWEIAGSLSVAATTAWAAVDAVGPADGDTVVVSAAAGGVGSVATQLARLRGADVIGIASTSNHEWLRSRGVVPVAYGDDLEQRIRDAVPGGVDAFIDLYGPEYLDLAVALGVNPERIETIISFERAGQIGAKTAGSVDGTTTEVLAELAKLIAEGDLEIPIAATYPLDQVREAFAELEDGHVRGKIVLIP
jgi:NADPH:quinone reductase